MTDVPVVIIILIQRIDRGHDESLSSPESFAPLSPLWASYPPLHVRWNSSPEYTDSNHAHHACEGIQALE